MKSGHQFYYTDFKRGRFVKCWHTVLGLCDKVLIVVGRGGDRGGFCGKLLQASPVSDRANATRLRDGPAAEEG